MSNQDNVQTTTWLHCPNCAKKLVQNFAEQGDFEVVCNSCYAKIRYTIEAGHVSYEFTRQPKQKRNTHYPTNRK